MKRTLFTIAIVAAMLCMLAACGSVDTTSDENETNDLTEETDQQENTGTAELQDKNGVEDEAILQIGESGIYYNEELGTELEITLKHFNFVDFIYDYEFYTLTEFWNEENSIPQPGNTLAAVTYTVENIGKSAVSIDCGFGQLEYGDGYIYSDESAPGLYILFSNYAGSKDTKSYYDRFLSLDLQPLSESAEITSFFEVPSELRDDWDNELYYELWGVKYKIPTDCRVTNYDIEDGEILNAKDFKGKVALNYIGSKVSNYEAKNGADTEWEIFYAGSLSEAGVEIIEPRIYLIASDYVSKEFIPEECAHNSYGDDYKFSLKVSKAHQTGSESITDETMRALNFWYFFNSWESTNKNISKVAGMLDTEIWSGFTDKNGNAEYAIGGPTLELLFDSYNERYFESMSATAPAPAGYIWSSGVLNDDGLYVISETNKANAYWLASPAASGVEDIATVTYWGEICSYGDSTVCGFRPVICLNADVQLQKTEDGNFVIVD